MSALRAGPERSWVFGVDFGPTRGGEGAVIALRPSDQLRASEVQNVLPHKEGLQEAVLRCAMEMLVAATSDSDLRAMVFVIDDAGPISWRLARALRAAGVPATLVRPGTTYAEALTHMPQEAPQ